MFKVKLLFVALMSAVLAGCASPGPMQTPQGVMSTPVFEHIALGTINDGSEKVLFKEYTTMYEDKELKIWGVFFITDKGAYLASWDTVAHQYNLIYKVKAENIEKVYEDVVVREYWVDSNLLVIADKLKIEAGFALLGKNAAKTTLSEIVKLKNET